MYLIISYVLLYLLLFSLILFLMYFYYCLIYAFFTYHKSTRCNMTVLCYIGICHMSERRRRHKNVFSCEVNNVDPSHVVWIHHCSDATAPSDPWVTFGRSRPPSHNMKLLSNSDDAKSAIDLVLSQVASNDISTSIQALAQASGGL